MYSINLICYSAYKVLWQCLNVVIVREQVLIRFSERGSVLLIARCARGRRKTLFPILTRSAPYARVLAGIRDINCPIHFVRERAMFPNIKLMSMQNLIRI